MNTTSHKSIVSKLSSEEQSMGKEGCAKIAKSFQFSNSNSEASNYLLVLLCDPNFISKFDLWFTVNKFDVMTVFWKTLGLRNAYVPLMIYHVNFYLKYEYNQ